MTKSLFIITGASKGFGKWLAELLWKSSLSHGQPSDFILMARTSSLLQESANFMQNTFPHPHPTSTIQCHQIDFQNLDNLEFHLDKVLSGMIPSSYHRTYLINNAGSLGKLDRLDKLSLSDIRQAMDINVTACIYVTSRFLRQFSGSGRYCTIVNISSLAAVQPFDSWGLYAAGKAARDMIHRTLAIEEEEREYLLNLKTASPSSSSSWIRSLNYAPGPLNTDMQALIRNDMPDGRVKTAFTEMHMNHKLVDPMDSARVLVQLLIKDKWKNGDHIDYFDWIGQLL